MLSRILWSNEKKHRKLYTEGFVVLYTQRLFLLHIYHSKKPVVQVQILLAACLRFAMVSQPFLHISKMLYKVTCLIDHLKLYLNVRFHILESHFTIFCSNTDDSCFIFSYPFIFFYDDKTISFGGFPHWCSDLTLGDVC